MASTKTKHTRSQRAASLKLQPGGWRGLFHRLIEGHSLWRWLVVLVCCAALVAIFRGWEPPFSYREGDVPTRDIIARVPFTIVDHEQTQALRDQKRREVLCFYVNDPRPFEELTADLLALLRRIECQPSEQSFETEQLDAVQQLVGDRSGAAAPDVADAAQELCKLLHRDPLEPSGKLLSAIQQVLAPIAEQGVLTKLSHDSDQGSQRSIIVLPEEIVVDVARVRYSQLVEDLPQAIVQQIEQAYGDPDVVPAARIIADYLARKLPKNTLVYDRERSEQSRRRAEASVHEAEVSYYASVSRLAIAGQPITRDKELPLLQAEHAAWLASLSTVETAFHFLAFMGMLAAVCLLCGIYIYAQYDRQLLSDTYRLVRLGITIVVACLLCRWAAAVPLRAEIMPLVAVAFTITIAYGRQMGLLLATCLALIVTLGLGFDLAAFVTLAAGGCAASLLLGRIRTRTRLMYVGVLVALIVAATHVGVQTVRGMLHVVNPETIDLLPIQTAWRSMAAHLFWQSLQLGGMTIAAAALMTGVLPFIEKIFDVQTDLRLLELGDASHPLLRQLAQRAPGTYNHSINVAAIAEAAADAIGAHGLLTRVGAYFHDIGKMFKPNYFIENQDQGTNTHAALQPAMSTLVIIAHVKDGANLARQHGLPRRIIDFIEQHHGTTLVEYFYREATKRNEANPNKEVVSETSFRYPGPKPQTLEAAVLMLADSVESASRALVEPTPARIQHLVDAIAMKKLLDGQFDECGLTLRQLHTIKQSLVKSLTAIYHGRIKYPDQATA
ncbi:MAG: 7TM receptor with intracellular metal dependent phosphohydrolase [Pirellulaceae bacterium]|nr:MAG: 7TM receptor with intracellular metal dependent phosphohydrolase [Pirellulaceae bacterium]